MTDQRDPYRDPLELDLVAWFKAAPPPAAPASVRAVLERLGADSPATGRPDVAVVGWRMVSRGRLAASATTFSVIVLAVALLVLFGQHGPAAPTDSPIVAPSREISPGPTSPQPTVAPSAPSPIDDGGTFGANGLWAVVGDQLHLSTNGGDTWAQRSLVPGVALDVTSGNVLSSVFVLDASHAWTASPGPGSTVPYGGQGPTFDHLHVLVSRTTNGGATWQSVSIPGDWGGTQPVLAFPDQQHGFLLLSGLRGGPGSTVFATADGGAAWQRVGGAKSLGSVFGASDATTLWAGNEGDAGPVARPILDVSRDGGRTWTDARLPGLVGDIYVNDTLVAAPVFSGDDGAVAVVAGSTDNPPDVRFYRTTDDGGTWSLAARTDLNQNGSVGVAVIDPEHFAVIDSGPGQVTTTSDGGATWQRSQSSRVGAVLRLRFWNALHGVAVVEQSNGPSPAAGLLRTTDGGKTWAPVSIATAAQTSPTDTPAPSPSSTMVAMPKIPSPPPAQATSTWTPATLPQVSATGVFGGPADGISALPGGGGFIDCVSENSTRTLVLMSQDGSRWRQTGEVIGEGALGVTGPVASDGHSFVALGSEGGGVNYGARRSCAGGSVASHWPTCPATIDLP
jgi:hypothetical protein